MTNTPAYYTTIGNCDKFYFTLEFKVQMWVQIYQIFKRDLIHIFSIQTLFVLIQFELDRIVHDRPNIAVTYTTVSVISVKMFYNKGTSSHTNVIQPYLIPFFRFCLSKLAFVNKAQFRTKRVMLFLFSSGMVVSLIICN
jgi:hypothetical protein